MRLIIPLALGVVSVASCAASASRAGAPFDNTYWRLVELNGQPAIAVDGDREAHLRFSEDSARVVGSTGCNRLTGTFTREGTGLRFGPAITTRMACVDPRLNEQEQRLVAALQATERHEIAGDTLTLIATAGPLARLAATAR